MQILMDSILENKDGCSQVDEEVLLGEELDVVHVAPKSSAKIEEWELKGHKSHPCEEKNPLK